MQCVSPTVVEEGGQVKARKHVPVMVGDDSLLGARVFWSGRWLRHGVAAITPVDVGFWPCSVGMLVIFLFAQSPGVPPLALGFSRCLSSGLLQWFSLKKRFHIIRRKGRLMFLPCGYRNKAFGLHRVYPMHTGYALQSVAAPGLSGEHPVQSKLKSKGPF